LVWGMTDTKDDALFPHEITNETVDGIRQSATRANLNTAPGDPSTVNVFYAGKTTLRINDLTTKIVNTYDEWGGEKNRIELGGSWQRTDPSGTGIEDAARDVRVFTTTSGPPAVTAPTGLKLVSQTPENIDKVRSTLTTDSGKLNSIDRLKVPRNTVTIDANSIADAATNAKEWFDNAARPTVPDVPPTNNVKIVSKRTSKVYDAIGTSPGLNLEDFIYGARDSRDELILPNTQTTTDASSLTGSALRAYLDGESVPSTPSGLVLRDTKDRPVTTGLGTNRTETVLEFGVRTHQQDREFLESRTVTDATNLRKAPIVCKVTASSSHDFDADNPDSTNCELIWGLSHQETNSGKWVHVGEFGPMAPDTELKAEHEIDEKDPATLDDNTTVARINDENTRAVIDTNAVALAAPASTGELSGKVCWKHWTKKRGKTTYLHVYLYRYRDSVREIEAEKYRLTTDVSGLESRAVTAKVYAIASVPTTPTYADYGLDSTFVLSSFEDINTPNPGFKTRIYLWALLTRQQELEFAHSLAEDSPLIGLKDETASIVAYAGTARQLADSVQTAHASDATYIGVKVRRIVPGQFEQIIQTINEDKRVLGMPGRVMREVYRGIPSGAAGNNAPLSNFFNNTAAVVEVKALGQSAGGLGFLELQPQERDVVRGGFIYQRVLITDTPELYFYTTLLKNVNNAPFLGYATYTVRYAWVRVFYTYSISGVRRTVYHYFFEVSDDAFVNPSQILVGRVDNNSALPITSSGFVSATRFSADSLLIWPPSAAFAPFVS
jgi:hypothetical protein